LLAPDGGDANDFVYLQKFYLTNELVLTMLDVITPSPVHRQFTWEEAEEFQEKIEGKIEFMDGLLIPKEGEVPIPAEVVSYVLSEQFNLEAFQNQFLMPKSSYNHKKILAQLTRLLNRELNLSLYEQYTDMEISRKWLGYYYVPDITVSLVKNEILDEHGHLTNPTSIIEILSPSTEKKDRTEKKNYYQSLDSLQEYILIAQDTYKIEQFLRKGKTNWIVKVYDSADQSFVMTVGVKLKVKDVYQNTDWTE